MSSVFQLFQFGLLFLRKLLVAFFVFSIVRGDAGDLDRVFLSAQPSGYVYHQLAEEPTHIYVPPLTPVFADDPYSIYPQPFPPPPEKYLSPNSQPVYLPPPNNEVYPPVGAPFPLPPPPDDDTVVVPALPPQNSGVFFPTQPLTPPQFKIENMSCIQGVNFRVTFKMATDLSQFPVVEEGTEGCITPLSGSMYKIDLENFNNMLKCGVRRCKSNSLPPQVRSVEGNNNFRNSVQGAENMCVVLRMPTVRGVRLPEDQMLTLMCTPQEKVVSRTRHVRLGSNRILQNVRARSTNGFIATGGSQKDLKSRISIFRKRVGSNAFDQNVQPENVIQLGEELVLRAGISDEDGWQGSQIGPILITGLKSKKSALLVNQNGCVNPVMKSICPQQPIKISPLSAELHFRAFLFQESPQGDEMVISVKMQGCLHPQDCQKVDPCKDDLSTVRAKRELTNFNNTANQKSRKDYTDFSEEIKNWETQLWFKVEPWSAKESNSKFTISKNQETLYWFVLYLMGFIFLTTAIVIILIMWRLFTKKERTIFHEQVRDNKPWRL